MTSSMSDDSSPEIAEAGSTGIPRLNCADFASSAARPLSLTAAPSSPLRPAVPHYLFSQIMDKHLTHFGRASSVVFRKKEPRKEPALQQGQIVVTKRFDSTAHEWELSVTLSCPRTTERRPWSTGRSCPRTPRSSPKARMSRTALAAFSDSISSSSSVQIQVHPPARRMQQEDSIVHASGARHGPRRGGTLECRAVIPYSYTPDPWACREPGTKDTLCAPYEVSLSRHAS